MFPDSNDFIFRHSSATNTLDVGDWYVAHYLTGDIAHCTVSVEC